jgi:hypothetical protein
VTPGFFTTARLAGVLPVLDERLQIPLFSFCGFLNFCFVLPVLDERLQIPLKFSFSCGLPVLDERLQIPKLFCVLPLLDEGF